VSRVPHQKAKNYRTGEEGEIMVSGKGENIGLEAFEVARPQKQRAGASRWKSR